MSFSGSSVHTISENGRVSIPSKIRDVLRRNYSDESIVLTVSRPLALDKAFLLAYPAQEWEKLEKSWLNPQNRKEAFIARQTSANSEDVSIDKQGRILISQSLRAKAGLIGECVIVGRINRIEIWDKDRWDIERTEFSNDSEEELGPQFGELTY